MNDRASPAKTGSSATVSCSVACPNAARARCRWARPLHRAMYWGLSSAIGLLLPFLLCLGAHAPRLPLVGAPATHPAGEPAPAHGVGTPCPLPAVAAPAPQDEGGGSGHGPLCRRRG